MTTPFKKRTELNPENSDFTGNVMAVFIPKQNTKHHTKGTNAPEVFVQIQDCHRSITLHPDPQAGKQAFLLKLLTLIQALQDFHDWLEENWQ